MKYAAVFVCLLLGVLAISSGVQASAASTSSASHRLYDITTLAGKIASVQASLGGRAPDISAPIDFEVERVAEPASTAPSAPINPTFVLSSSLDGESVQDPAVTVNQDTRAATQNEPAIAVDPNNPNRIVVAANDYVTRTWSCQIGGVPCSALGDGYSGTYYSNDGGATWCCVAEDPRHLGTLVPGVTRLSGGQYDAGGDPALAFDSQGNVYYAGLGFDRTAPPNTVAVNKGTFGAGPNGALHWGPPTFINPTTSPSTFNDKEWIGVDSHASSPFRDRVYVSWTRFIFGGPQPFSESHYIQSPIAFVFSDDGGRTFSDPKLIVDNVLYDQGSRVVVGSDGAVYVFWEGSTRLATFNSIWMVKSTDGGVTFSKPVAVAPAVDIISPANTVFRVNSFPAADIAPDGKTLYVAWSSEVRNTATTYGADPICAFFISGTTSVRNNCHAAAVWSRSTNGGAMWSTPVPILPDLDASTRTAIGYPVPQPDGSGTLNMPAARRVDTFWPGVAISSSGRVYMSAYGADVVSPWQTCAMLLPPPVGRINCLGLGNYINNARLDYYVTNIGTGEVNKVTTHPINSRYHFGGGFIGDYTGLAVGSDNVFHAVWTDTNNVQSVTWWYGFQFVSTPVHQQDIVTGSGRF